MEPPVEPAPRGYSVREIHVDLPNAQALFLGDDSSVAGNWQNDFVTFEPTLGSFWVLGVDGALRDFNEVQPDFNSAVWIEANESIGDYKGRFASGTFWPALPVGVGVGQASFTMDTQAAEFDLLVDGWIAQLEATGEAVGTQGHWMFSSSDRAFYWDGDLMRTVPVIHDAQDIGSRALQLRDGKIYGTIGQGSEPEEQEQVFVWHFMEMGPDVVMVYPLGHPEYSIEPEPELPEVDSLHELIDEDDWWFGRVTFTHVHDVNAQGEILADGCTIAGCGSFVLAPPQ